ncbi:plastocyanin/azurin family copper-binding protein [Roseovarius sp. 2305UL8-3]|uniref:plastocyanin/azurin family copper-binding protein n=1 Tax=Roseovarius conchicola TaxID=3121636 RepID=UPI003527F5F8
MTQSKRGINRRTAIQITIAASCCGGAAHAGGPKVDQITDPGAREVTDMFRFSPDLITVERGSEVAFLNSRGEHTVHSVPQLWPEGVPEVGISNNPEAIVGFPTDGLYGFRCRRHGQYGMVMLVVVGEGGDLSGIPEQIDAMRASDREKEAFAKLLARYQETREA